MAAVLDTKTDPAAKFDTKVDEQIAEATSRIRFHDLTFGGLLLAAMVLAYFTAMIVLDKYLVLPEWARQLALGGFVLAAGATAWLTVVRPMRRQINPLYAAVRVERTVDDAKNSVAGYVDAKNNDQVHPTVRAAMGARAAKSAAEADLNLAVDHKSLVYVGGVVVALVLALVVLFFVFRPAQFRSLAGRTLVPFSSDAIATRTQLTLLKPDPPDQTITAGQSVVVAVHVAGKVPAADSPDKVRLLIRHNPADPNFETVPMERGDSSRDWSVRVPDYLVQNGFWYKVAAGDTESSEHKISVRTAPLFTDFEADYEFPAYLRMKPLTGVKGNRLLAFRGTKVTLTAKTNREVKDGRMDVDPTGERITGKPAPNRPDSLRFEYKLVENGSYRLHFTATNGERNADPPPFAIQVLSDVPPTVTVLKPEEDEIPLPANGLLAVDATVGDDFGIDKVTLKLKLVGDAEKPLADKPFLEGKSFLRATDNTWPTVIDYKDSVDLGKLKDANGLSADLKEGLVLEYWLEALDNCTEPKANVGKSKVQRVRLTAPVKEPDPMKQQDAERNNRKTEENKNNTDQKQRLDNEERKPPQDPQQNPQQQPENNPPKKEDGKGGDAGTPKNDAKQDNKQGEAKKDNKPGGPENNPPKNGEQGGKQGPDMPPPKNGEQGKTDPPPESKGGTGQKNDTPMKAENTTPKNENTAGGMGNTGTPEAPPPREPGQKSPEDQAREIQQELDNQRKNEGSAKPNPGANASDRTDPAQPKPQPMGGQKPDDPGAKPPPKQDPMNPMGGGNAAQTKPEGNVEQPPPPSAPKPNEQPKEPMGGEPQKPQPKGGQAGEEQPTPKGGGMNEPQPKGGSEGTGKPAGEQPKDPQGAGANKPMNEPNRGGEQPPPQGGANQPEKKEPDAGGGKPQQSPQAGAQKPGPKDPMNPAGDTAQKPPPQGGMGDPMMPQPGDPAAAKPDKQPGTPENKGVDKGTDQGDPQANATPEKKGGEPKNGGGGAGEKKLDPKEIADAAKDLNSPDPAKQQAARDKLDKAMGKENREAAEKLANDLKSPDKNTREAAEKKLEGMRKDAEEQAKKDGKGGNDTANKDKKGGNEQANKDGKGGAGEKLDPKDVEQNIRDLNSPDDKTRAAAKDKLDKQLGEKGRKEAEDIAKGMQSGDFEERGKANRKLNDLKKDIEKKGEEQAGKQPSKEEIEKTAKAAENLTSKDDAKRQAAEKELDNKIGKENRENLQEMMKDAQSDDPQKREAAKKKLEQMQEALKGKRDGSPGDERAKQRQMLDDAKRRLEAGNLQLEEFKKNADNKELLDKLKMSKEDYERYVKGYEDRLAAEAKEVAAAEQELAKPLPPPGTATQNVSGANKVAGRKGDDGKAVVGGTTFAPPGFTDAARKFKEDAARLNSTPKR